MKNTSTSASDCDMTKFDMTDCHMTKFDMTDCHMTKFDMTDCHMTKFDMTDSDPVHTYVHSKSTEFGADGVPLCH